MRTRDKSLSDYGIDCSRAAELVELARLEENKGKRQIRWWRV